MNSFHIRKWVWLFSLPGCCRMLIFCPSATESRGRATERCHEDDHIENTVVSENNRESYTPGGKNTDFFLVFSILIQSHWIVYHKISVLVSEFLRYNWKTNQCRGVNELNSCHQLCASFVFIVSHFFLMVADR